MRSIKIILAIIGIMAIGVGPAIGAGEKEEDWVEKGLKLIGQQQYDEAIEAFSIAIDIIPRDYQAYNYRGVVWALKGDFDQAIADYDKALKILPRYAAAFNNRGFAQTQKGDLQQSLNDYTRALEINPYFVDAYNNKAWILATSADKRYRNGAQAIMLAQKAVELKPDVESLDTLAAAYAAVGNFEAAIDTQKKAVQKLLLAEKKSEVPKYLAHLNTYRSQQALRVNYTAAYKPAKTGTLEVAPQPKKKEKPTQPANTKKVAPPSKAKQVVAASKPKQVVAASKPKQVVAASKPKQVVAASKPKQVVAASKAKQATTASETKSALAPAFKALPYTIQVSAYRDLQISNQVAGDLIKKGHQAFSCPVQISGKGKWHRVYIGNYKTYEEAKIAAAELKKRKFRYVHIAKKPYAVQVGPVGSAEALQTLKIQLQVKGYLPYSLPAGIDQGQTRVLIGAYESKKAAVNLTNQLK
jgi:Flp pilus assembly protein TadD